MRRARLGDFVIACRQGVSKSIVPTLPLLACLVGCSHRDTTEPSNMMCVQRLQMPWRYPWIAQAGRVSMNVTATITVASDGKVQSIVLEGATGPRPDLVNLFQPTI